MKEIRCREFAIFAYCLYVILTAKKEKKILKRKFLYVFVNFMGMRHLFSYLYSKMKKSRKKYAFFFFFLTFICSRSEFKSSNIVYVEYSKEFKIVNKEIFLKINDKICKLSE